MPKSLDTTGRTWTYGAEHELADWDTRLGWDGYGRDPEPNICNSNGIAGDPTLRDNPYGAEINTPPTSKPEDQADLLQRFLKRHKHVFVSQRIGMHIHVRIPGLKDSLWALKKLQRYITGNTAVYQLIDPVPYADRSEYLGEDEWRGMRKWVQYIRRSHWTAIPEYRVAKQLKAGTVKEFMGLEAPVDKSGKPLFHAQPRASVNLRQLVQSDTVEFRPFFQTLDPNEVTTAVEWCRDYLLAAFEGYPAVDLFNTHYKKRRFPPRPKYLHWLEKRWAATSHSRNDRVIVRRNIAKILRGEFDDVVAKDGEWDHLDWLVNQWGAS